MEWLQRLGAAIDYIEENLDKEISYDEAARIACCSSYYFQRVFSYAAGVSLPEYIRRRKMTQAAFELRRTEGKVIDIALKYGYSSPTAFNRAFQKVHGITPTAAKSADSVLQAYPAIRFRVEVTGEKPMAYHITEKPSIRIVGTRILLTSDMEENRRIVPRFWKTFLQGEQFEEICRLFYKEPSPKHDRCACRASEQVSNQISDQSSRRKPELTLSEKLNRNPGQAPGEILGISVYENPREIYYYIGVATDAPAPSGMYEYEIPASTWVIFENEGSFKEDVQSVFRRFFMELLPFSGYKYGELPDIEVYPIDDRGREQGHSEVWIAISRENRGK